MSKKKKNHPHPPVETSPIEAARWLAEGKYKEAIEAYKQLLKAEPRQEWQDALATAYLERAKAFANKNMFSEAAALWENRAGLCENAGPVELYLIWLLLAGRYGKAIHLYLEHAEKLPDTEETRQLPVLLGALLLIEKPGLAQHLPDHSPFVQQNVIAKAALQAYCRGDNELLETQLKQIPFRSPYRDFRTLLKGLQLLPTNSSEALQLLEKIPPLSPYFRFVELLTVPITQLETTTKLSSQERATLVSLKGWGKEPLELLAKLQSRPVRETNQALFEVMIAYQSLLGQEFARRVCLSLLPFYPPLANDYEKAFKISLSEFAKRRFEALYFEQRNQFPQADQKWREALEILKRETSIPDQTLKIALIFRHLADLGMRSDHLEIEEVIADLEASLKFDPEDKATYLKIAQLYQQQEELKKYSQWIETAVKRFPKESDVLLAAMEMATQKKAFKKAVGFANTLLKVDPINVKARHTLLASHLSHARKMVKSGRYDLARKELSQAASVEKSSQRNGAVQIQQGLIFLKEGESGKGSAKQLLQEGFQLAGGGLCGHLRVMMETKLLGSKKLEEQVLLLIPPLELKYLPRQQEVLELISLLNAYQEEGVKLTKKTLASFEAPLQNATQYDFSRDELISICQCFKQIAHYEWLQQYARLAHRKWPEQPIFTFYQVVGNAAGQWQRLLLHEEEIDRLHRAMEQAEQQGDTRTSMMIMAFMAEMTKQQFEARGVFMNFPLDLLEELAGEEEDGELGLSEEEWMQMMERLDKLGIPRPPDAPNLPERRVSEEKKQRKK